MEIHQDLRRLADKRVKAQNMRFFKTGKGEYGEGDLFLGITMPQLRAVAKKNPDLSKKQVVRLIKSRFHEERMAGLIILVNQFQKSAAVKDKKELFGLYVKHFKYINNWDLVDVTCSKIIGPYLENKNRKILYQWAKSKNLWTRRIAIISTFHFIRLGDLNDTLKLAAILLNDDHDLIHKAVGWAVREVGKKDLKLMESFLRRFYKTMPRTTLRYAIEKLPRDRQKKYLKGTI